MNMIICCIFKKKFKSRSLTLIGKVLNLCGTINYLFMNSYLKWYQGELKGLVIGNKRCQSGRHCEPSLSIDGTRQAGYIVTLYSRFFS